MVERLLQSIYASAGPALRCATEKKLKDKRSSTRKGEHWFCIAGILRFEAKVGEAFTMLTMQPGQDIALSMIARSLVWSEMYGRVARPHVSAKDALRPLHPGSLSVEQVG